MKRHPDDGSIRELGDLDVETPRPCVTDKRRQGNRDLVSCLLEFRQFNNELKN